MSPGRYMTVLVGTVLFVGSRLDAQKVYWTESDPPRIQRANLDGSEASAVLTRLVYRIQSMAINPIDEKIYWINQDSPRRIERLNKDGTGLERLVTLDEDWYDGLALDPAAGKLYWSSYDGSIRRANLDGTQAEIFLYAGSHPGDLALDAQGRIYWAGSSGIWRENMDGYSWNEELIVSTRYSRPRQIEIVPSIGKIFWTASDSGDWGIFRADLDGTNVETLFVRDHISLYVLAIDSARDLLYWFDWQNKLINRCSWDGSALESYYQTTEQIAGLEVDEATGDLFWSGNSSFFIERLPADGTTSAVFLDSRPVYPTSLAIDIARNKLLMASRASAYFGPIELAQSRLDGTEFQRNFTLADVTQMVFEPDSRFLYYTHETIDGGEIRKADVDSEHIAVLSTFEEVAPVGIAVDSSQESLYWTVSADSGPEDTIQRSDQDGQNVENIVANLVHYPDKAVMDPATGFVFWIDSGVWRCNSDGTNVQRILTSPPNFTDIAFDASHAKLFLADSTTPSMIRRCNPDGSELEEVFDSPLVTLINGIAVDSIHGKIYWIGNDFFTSGYPNKIWWANLDGSAIEELVNVGTSSNGTIVVDGTRASLCWLYAGVRCADLIGDNITVVPGISPTNLSLDSASGKLYWTEDRYQGDDRLWRVNVDGSELELVAAIGAGNPRRVAVDGVLEKMVWTDIGNNNVRGATIDGSSVVNLVVNPLFDPAGIAVDETTSHVYWTDIGDDSIKRAGLDGSNIETLISTGLSDPWVLTIHDEKMYWIERGNHSPSAGKLRRANLDGSEVEDLATDIDDPLGLAIGPSAHIASSSPHSCAIDARQPHDIADVMFRYGWSETDLEFSDTLDSEDLLDFELSESGGIGVPPNIESVALVADNVVRITLNDVIEPGAWTCFHHINSGTKSCLGYLPGDVDGDGTSSPVDILRLVDSMNGVIEPPYYDWQVDINRSGMADPGDILRLIDLLNGASKFDVWNGQTLHACP